MRRNSLVFTALPVVAVLFAGFRIARPTVAAAALGERSSAQQDPAPIPAPAPVPPILIPTPMPIVAPEIHPRIHLHLQNPVLHIDHDFDAEQDSETDQDIDVEPDEMEHQGPEVDIDTDHDDFDSNVRAEEKIQKSFAMPAAHRSLEIDNVWGSIEIVGTNSDQVQLTVNKSIRAESKEKLEDARKQVTLDITDQPDSLKLYVNGPFRCNCNDGCGHHDFEGYVVKMDFQLQVPRNIDIKVKTVNEGRVSVRDINGSFLVRNVNGDIQIHNIGGSGSARTVNGPVKVSFRQNPTENSDFQTVNGAVELQFAKTLAADFHFKTMNGGIYSDFPVTALPVSAMQGERHGTRFVYRSDRFTGARVGSGGPQIKVENLNGDIRILENHE